LAPISLVNVIDLLLIIVSDYWLIILINPKSYKLLISQFKVTK